MCWLQYLECLHTGRLVSNERIEALNIRKNRNCIDVKIFLPCQQQTHRKLRIGEHNEKSNRTGKFRMKYVLKTSVYHFCNSLKLNRVILLISLQFISSILASIILKHKSIRLSPILSTSFLVLIKHRYERVSIGNQDENSEKKQLSESRYFPHFISTWHSYTWSIKHTIFS